MTRPPGRLALAALAAVLLLSACGDGRTRSGAAALVGDQQITVEALRQVVERGLSDPQAAQQLGADRAAFQQQTLSRLINRILLEDAAREAGVQVTEDDVDEQIEMFVAEVGGRAALDMQAAQGGIQPQDLPRFVRDIVLEDELASQLTEDVVVPPEQLQALYEENIALYDQVSSRHILVADEATARMLLEQVRADPSRFGALAAQFSTDTSNKDDGGELGFAGRGQFVPEFEQVLFSAEPGTFEVANTQFGWHVIGVAERQTTTLEEATPQLRRAALQEQRQTVTLDVLRETAERLDVTVNPRFGRWDAENITVAAAPDPNGVLSPAPGTGPDDVPDELIPDGQPPAPPPAAE